MSRSVSVTFVIMAGGKGERLWPLVRANTPKVCLSPDGKYSLLRTTIDRLHPVWPTANWLIVTTQEQERSVRCELPKALQRRVLVEPEGKNTAACITLGAVALAAENPRRVMVAVPADHWIGNRSVFQRAIRTAIHISAQHHAIATIGIPPTHPHPGLGYLCAGLAVTDASAPRTSRTPVFRLNRFIEKPSSAVAKHLMKQRRTYWNSGIFIGPANTFLEQIAAWLPQHSRRLTPLVRVLRRGSVSSAELRLAYRMLEPISFDHGVMQHVRKGFVVEGRFAWEDLGSWDTWARLNRSVSNTVTVDCECVSVVGERGHLVAAIGVRDLVVVQTPSATLLCRADQTQRVREVVKRLSTNRQLAAYL